MSERKYELTNFGQEVSTMLASRSMTQAALASSINKSPNHLNHKLYGRYSHPTASWAELVANALELSEADRYRLHLAAAKDSGFKL